MRFLVFSVLVLQRLDPLPDSLLLSLALRRLTSPTRYLPLAYRYPAGGVFEPDREDNMPRMPPSNIDIHLESPRQWSPISYAFLGDAVYELYVRRLFFTPPSKPLEYDLKCKRAVRAEAQDAVLRHLMDVHFFSDDELGIVKWGRNASYGNTPQRLRGKGKGGFAIYRNASALECVVGYLYMTDMARLEEMMGHQLVVEGNFYYKEDCDIFGFQIVFE